MDLGKRKELVPFAGKPSLSKKKEGRLHQGQLFREGVPIQEDRLVDFRSITGEDLLLVEVELE